MKNVTKIGVILLGMLLLTGYSGVQAQSEPIGGPYEPDSATVVLLHFDGNLTNESSLEVSDGAGHGSIAFIGQSPIDGGNQSAYMDNDSPSDSTYIAIADTPALDLTGSWTMEGWVNLFTYGETSDDHRWRPKLLVKPGTDVRSHSNFYNVLRGDLQCFNTGYWTPSGGGWVEIRSPNNFFLPGNWYHVAFMRDSSKNVIVQVVHNEQREMIHFEVYNYDPITESPPNSTGEPAYIGINLGQGGGWLDGFLEEIRVSNVVRNFNIPPLLLNATQLGNQSTGHPYDVQVDATKIGSGEITSVNLYYGADTTSFTEVALTNTEGNTYAGQIPEQDFGQIIYYYYKAEDSNGLTADLPNRAELDNNYYNFGVYRDSTQTLALNFEEGSGSPLDTTAYGHEVTVYGGAAYSDDAIEGNYSMALEDSGYLEIQSPFLSTSKFTVDFWFKPDSMPPGELRFLIKEGGGSWFQSTYQVRTYAGGRVTPSSYTTNGTYVHELFSEDSARVIEPGNWYHAVYQVGDGYAYFEFSDSIDALINSEYVTIEGEPVITTGPFRIGHHNGVGAPYFYGKVDDVKIYNFARDAITKVEEDFYGRIPQRITLHQNYPNPFNPVTTISYSVPTEQHVQLAVYDLLGRKVATLTNKQVTPGTHSVKWDATNESGVKVSSGIYFYKLKSAAETRVKKMVLIR